MENKEFNFKGFTMNGFAMLFATLLMLVASGFLLYYGIEYENGWKIAAGVVLLLIAIVCCCGFMMV